MMRRTAVVVAIGVLAAVVACGDNDSGVATVTAPFHAIPDDSVVVSGTAACDFTDEGVDPEDGAGFLVVCELDMSDPRVSGTERHDRFRFVVGSIGAGTVWVAEESVITNDEGTWRGSMQAAENEEAVPAGEAHYVGHDAYEGLEFHYYFFHLFENDDDPAQLRGWISGDT